MFNEINGSGGTNDPKPLSDVNLKWATANPQELQSAFEEFARDSRYISIYKSTKIYPENASIVSDYDTSVWRHYFVKGEKSGVFDLSDYARFEKRELMGGGFVYVPIFVKKDIEGTIDAINLDRVGTSLFHDGLGRYVRREGKDFDLYVDERGGHVDEIFGCHRKDGKIDGVFNFARSETRSPIEVELDFGARTITTGDNSVEATYVQKEDGERVVILKVVQKGEPLGTITIPVIIDNERVKRKLFPESDFADPFNAHPNADSSWLETDLLETVGIVWNLKSR